MTITKQEEFKLPNGQTISIQFNSKNWEVACWNTDDTAYWYKEFDNEAHAREEYKRFAK